MSGGREPPLPLKTTSEISVLQWISALLATAASWQVAVRSRHLPRTPYVSASGVAQSSPSANPAPGAATSPRLYNDLPDSVAADQETIGSPTAFTALARSASRAPSAAIPLWFKSKFRPGGSAPRAKRSSSVTSTFACFDNCAARMLPDTPAPAIATLKGRSVPRVAIRRRGAATTLPSSRRVGAGTRVNMDDAEADASCTSSSVGAVVG